MIAHCWTAEEAQQFLSLVHTTGPQMSAFYYLALDTGARRAELCGLIWQDLDLTRGRVSILRQLIKPGAPP